MSIEQIAQVVATVLGVVMGVSLTEWFVRVRHRRLLLEELASELSIHIPKAVVSWAAGIDPESVREREWENARQRSIQLLVRIATLARWPLRRHQEVREQS